MNYEEQIMSNDKYLSIFSPQMEATFVYSVCYPSNLFRNVQSLENWGIFLDIPQF